MRSLAVIAVLGAVGCSSDREFSCQVGVAGVCVRDGVSGQCVSPGYCAFGDPSCDGTGLRYDSTASGDLAGTCVTTGGGGDGGVENMCGGTEPLEGRPGDACGVCNSGVFACDGENALVCNGERNLEVPVTDDGTVEASTEFNGSFPATEAVDDNLGSSWFSKGPGDEADGQSKYTWSIQTAECISQVTAVGNGQHPDFPENFGFAQVTIEVYNGPVDGANLVFSESVNLPGTPDPDAVVAPEVMGTNVRLVFSGHEDPGCGGFAELIVNALR